uniref:E3 ubiquitin-protein ligase RNF182 n=1 Tax=Paramormyrops kingsleyae TaxID=1676925 RepID=A0A3B3TEM3_9TELE
SHTQKCIRYPLESMAEGTDNTNGFGMEELECKICFCVYTLGSRRPKVLDCCHRLCTKCLTKILDMAEGRSITCPFCRYPTTLPEEAVRGIPDDSNLVAALTILRRDRRNLSQNSTAELLLSPRHLGSQVNTPISHSSSNCLVITMMETTQEPASPHRNPLTPNPDYSSPSPESTTTVYQRRSTLDWASIICQTSAKALVWLFGLFYISSLPLGVYLLIMQETMLGILLVSLVPTSLVIFMVYGLCQDLCQRFWDCISS